jgi:hypothetical protein
LPRINIKFLALESLRRTFMEHTGKGNNFLNITPLTQQLRERIHKWDYMKLKSFYTAKEMVTRPKRQSTEWEKVFAGYTSDNGLITRIYRELKKLNSQRINDTMRKHKKKCSTYMSMKEKQIKTTLRFHFIPVEWLP